MTVQGPPSGLLIEDHPTLTLEGDHATTWRWRSTAPAFPSNREDYPMTHDADPATLSRLRTAASDLGTTAPTVREPVRTLYAAALAGALAAGREPEDAANMAAAATVAALELIAPDAAT
ncbi:hypothetical protein [Phenylobacterium sp.]|jgi:hypothetical protein|uniref:hypothetical protein n=1 Tax=Phenylobacterium sp. TaxID=1871053 RepID=UPI003784F8C3